MVQSSRSHRITRCGVSIVAATTLLAVWYVAAWLTASRAVHDGIVSMQTAQTIRPAFVPLIRFCNSDLPASGWLRCVWLSVNPPQTAYGLPGTLVVRPSPLAPQPTTHRDRMRAQFFRAYDNP